MGTPPNSAMWSISVNQDVSQEGVIALYSAGVFLPGPRSNVVKQALLYMQLILPLVDFLTDWINAGMGYLITSLILVRPKINTQ